MEILLIEDNAADRFWLEYVLQMFGLDVSLSSVVDGEQAVDFLLKRGAHSQAPTPDLIFLDVNLPFLDGIEVLRNVPGSRDLPICVLTGNESQRELFRQEFGIRTSDYLVKPVSYDTLRESSRFHELTSDLAARRN